MEIKDEEERSFGYLFGGFTFAILFMIPIAFLEGTVLRLFWGWFISPTFGIPKISLPVSIAITFVAQLFQTYRRSSGKPTYRGMLYAFFSQIFIAGIVLLEIWIVHLFI